MPVSTVRADPEAPLLPRDEDLIEEDGVPLESDWHRLAMNLLIEVVTCHLQDRDDYFVGGNMFIYFDEESVKERRFRGPDFFLVWGAPLNPPRRYWATWKEHGRYPNLIIELASRRTVKTDRTTKKSIYESIFQTREYFIYNPANQGLEGWRLKNGRYEPIAVNEQGWMWCEELGLWLGDWQGQFLRKVAVYPRFYDGAGQLVLTFAEAEKKHSEAETKRADAEHRRAEELAAELARVRAERKPNGRQKKK